MPINISDSLTKDGKRDAQLRATNLTVGFEKTPILADINLTLQPAEIVAIAGPNGVGKSTLVKALARQLKPLSGMVSLNDKEIWSLSAAQFASSVAYVPQSLEPGLEMTVEEIVMLGRNPHQRWWQWYGNEEDKRAVESALAATEMLSHRKKYLTQLSGGERQRACLATALAQEPVFMLLDEPTAHLDFKHQLDLVTQLKELKNRAIGCLIVLHDLNLIARIADRIVLLRAGEKSPNQVAAIGEPTEILTRENLAAVFQVDVQILRDPLSNELVYTPMKRTLN